MSKMNRLLAVLILSCSAFSCQEKPWEEDLEKKAADSVRGVYEIVSMTWQGEPVDLDDDGQAGTDVLKELMALPSLAGIQMPHATFEYEWEGKGGFRQQSVRVWLPLQWLELDYDKENYVHDALKGRYWAFDGTYSIDCTSEEIISFHSWTMDSYGERLRYPDAYEIGSAAEWTQTDYGRMRLKVRYAFHDHIRDGIVKDYVVIDFVRTQYR